MVTPACDGARVIPDFDQCYRAVESKDARFDGWFFTAVLTTRIYCRPSCPAVPPKAENMTFYPSAASCQQAGFRKCAIPVVVVEKALHRIVSDENVGEAIAVVVGE